MDDKFEIVWQALVEHGSSRKNREAVKRFWDTLSPAQQNAAAENIPRKVREGKYVQYNPIQAIKENIRVYQLPEPENLNMTSKYNKLERTTPLVSAAYKGTYGIFTLTQAEEFGLDIKYGMNFDYKVYLEQKAINPDYKPRIIIRD